jgi:hypothetical protein
MPIPLRDIVDLISMVDVPHDAGPKWQSLGCTVTSSQIAGASEHEVGTQSWRQASRFFLASAARAWSDAPARQETTMRGVAPTLSALTFAVLCAAGCSEDQNDPKVWVKKLVTPQRAEAIKTLVDIHQAAGPSTPKGKEIREVAVPALVWAYEDDKNRAEIVEALQAFKDRRAIPVYLKVLEGQNVVQAVAAAKELAEYKEASAIEPITKLVLRLGDSAEAEPARKALREAGEKIQGKPLDLPTPAAKAPAAAPAGEGEGAEAAPAAKGTKAKAKAKAKPKPKAKKKKR